MKKIIIVEEDIVRESSEGARVLEGHIVKPPSIWVRIVAFIVTLLMVAVGILVFLPLFIAGLVVFGCLAAYFLWRVRRKFQVYQHRT